MTKFPRARTIEGNDRAPLVHVPQGQHEYVGDLIARYADHVIRDTARAKGADLGATSRDKLCPPCYMVAMVNALIKLAEDNGQNPSYIANGVSGILDWIVREDEINAGLRAVRERASQPQDRAAAVELGKRVFSGLRGPVSRYCAFMDMSDPEALKARDAADVKDNITPEVRERITASGYDAYMDDYWLGYTPGAPNPLTREAFAAQIAKQEAERLGGVFLPEPGTGKTILQQWNEGHGDNFVHPTRTIQSDYPETDRERGHRYDHD